MGATYKSIWKRSRILVLHYIKFYRLCSIRLYGQLIWTFSILVCTMKCHSCLLYLSVSFVFSCLHAFRHSLMTSVMADLPFYYIGSHGAKTQCKDFIQNSCRKANKYQPIPYAYVWTVIMLVIISNRMCCKVTSLLFHSKYSLEPQLPAVILLTCMNNKAIWFYSLPFLTVLFHNVFLPTDPVIA